MTSKLQRIATPAPIANLPAEAPADFGLLDLRIFDSIPRHNHDVVVLRGIVAVYATDVIGREGILENAYYVRESQHPYSGMSWDQWLRLEVEDRRPRSQPRGALRTRRQVVRAIRWPRTGDWALRLESGTVDGPYHDWAFGADLIGKVVGIYRPVEQNS